MASVLCTEIFFSAPTELAFPMFGHPSRLDCSCEKVANWLPRPGKARVTYAEGSSFEGVFNGERIKEGPGKYTWMKPAEEDGEDPQVRTFAHTYIQ